MPKQTGEDIIKEYHTKHASLVYQQADACYAFGAYSDQEEKYDLKIWKLAQEYEKKYYECIKETKET